MSHCGTMGLAVYLSGLLWVQPAFAATDCDSQIQQLLGKPTSTEQFVDLSCSVKLDRSTHVISKPIRIRGSKASGLTLDCNGSLLQPSFNAPAIEISSIDNGDGTWSRPENITINNCRINGYKTTEPDKARIISIWGRSAHESSFSAGHTARMQAAAPKGIVLSNLAITANGGIPLYVFPGVTHVSLGNSEIKGSGDAVAIYLDAETGHNTIRDNYIHLDSTKREQIAIDGSAYNMIANNRFSGLDTGGIYLYRNCGEKGTVRHQTPHHNQILNNYFYYDKFDGGKPSVWLASRNGGQSFCGKDKDYLFGSGKSDLDYAQYNVVAQNQIQKLPAAKMIRSNDSPNFFFENTTVLKADSHKAGCFVELSHSKVFVHDGDYAAERTSGRKGVRHDCRNGLVKKSAPLQTDPIEFICTATSSNSGCAKAFRCPSGKKVVGIKLGCNLEQPDLAASAAGGLPWNVAKVFRNSDTVSDGQCGLSPEPLIRSGTANLAALLGTSRGFTAFCRERDQNGGDCIVRGEALCL